MKSLKAYKSIIKWVFWLTLALIAFLTLQAIYATDNWKWFNVDFNKRDHIIGAYGTLIGGVLAFLSILFVLYQVYEQREQIIQEKKDAEIERKQDLKDRLLLLSDFIKSILNDIVSNGEQMEQFYKAEKAAPSTMNTMQFSINKNFQRITQMDDLSMYRAIKLYLKDEENWQKHFLNLYELLDFYSEALLDLRAKYKYHTDDKVKELKQIGANMEKMLNLNAKFIDDYLTRYGENKYLNQPWSSLINNFSLEYHTYLKQVIEAGDVPNFRYISDKIIVPFIKNAMETRRTVGYDAAGSREIVELSSTIRKKIWEVETYSLQYANDVEKQFNNYFSQNNSNITQLSDIKVLIDSKLQNTKT